MLLTASMINAQKCKPKTVTNDFYGTKIDAWGGKLTSMSVYSFNVKYIPSMYVYKENEKYKIAVGMAIDGTIDSNKVINEREWFPKGSKFMIKLENEILTFTVEDREVRNSYVEVVSTINKDNIQKLIDQPILMFRINPFIENVNDLFFQFKVSKSPAKKIKQKLKCLLSQ